jgi:putative hemolysin
MNNFISPQRAVGRLLPGIGLLLLTGCLALADAPLIENAAAEVEVPAEVLKAQEVTLDFLHEGAYALSPPRGATWTVEQGGPDLPEGFVFYFFTSGPSVMTVSYPENVSADTVYHVSFGDTETSLCWQANVDARGLIQETGTASELSSGENNPAALYCEAKGYEYAIMDQPAGGQCGVCVFPDESVCKGWAYLRGQCDIGDFPSSAP